MKMMRKCSLFLLLFAPLGAQEDLPSFVERSKSREGLYEMLEKRDIHLEPLLNAAAAGENETELLRLLDVLALVLRRAELDDYLICYDFLKVLCNEWSVGERDVLLKLSPENRAQLEAVLLWDNRPLEAQTCFLRPYIEHREAFYEQLKQAHDKQAADDICARLYEFYSPVDWTNPPDMEMGRFDKDIAAPLILLREQISLELQRLCDADYYGSDDLKKRLSQMGVTQFAFRIPMKPLQLQWEEALRDGGELELSTLFTPVSREDIYQQLFYPLVLPFLQQAEDFHFVAYKDSMGFEKLILKAKGDHFYTCRLLHTNCGFIFIFSLSEDEEEIPISSSGRLHEFSSFEAAFEWFNK